MGGRIVRLLCDEILNIKVAKQCQVIPGINAKSSGVIPRERESL